VSKTTRSSALIWLLLAFLAGAAFGQTPASPVTVRSSRPEGASVAPGAVVTAPFMIRNTASDSVAIQQAITLPAGWMTVTSIAPEKLGADAMELWLVSVAAPAGAAAGTYVIRAGIIANGATVSDSMVVTIEERYALDVKSSAAPTYVLAGNSYDATFIVRNAGNVTTRVKLKATSNRGSAKLAATEMDLTPGATQPVKVTVSVPKEVVRSQQDLIEIIAIDEARDSVRASTSVETMIIAKGSDGADFWTIPGDFAVRAASANSGVSTFVASGSGFLSESGKVHVDFNAQTAPVSQSMFGERDQYRLGLSTQTMSLRAGDQSFGFSPLTSSGSQGTGGEVTGKRGGLVGGAYVQKNRWTLNSGAEMAAMVGSAEEAKTGGALVAMQRNSTVGASRVISGTAHTTVGAATMEVEAAGSDSVRNAGTAGLVRFYGSTKTFQYDLGVQQASNAFAGAQRASSDQHVSLSGQKLGSAVLSAMFAMHKTNPTAQSNGFGQRIANSSMTASWSNGSSVETERVDRNDFGSANGGVHGTQQSLRGRARVSAGAFDVFATAQAGIVDQQDSLSHGFTALSASVRARIGKEQYVSMFADLTDGRSLGAGGIGTITSGTSAELKLGLLTAIRLTTTMSAQRDRLNDWVGQADFTVERRVRQSIVSVRGRLAQSGNPTVPTQNAVFMEVRTPLRLPTARLNVGGRARAQVVDAESGRGVEGALVRMGEVAALTDKNGVASFKGLPGGEYHAVVEGGVAAGQIVEGGNVSVDSTSRETAEFKLNVTRGARVQARLRRLEKGTQGGGSGPSAPTDSMVDVGAVQGAVLALISSRDTIWQSADDRGRVDFGTIAPGHYTVKVVAGDVPEFTMFEKKEFELDVKAGEQRDIDFRLIPQIRTLQFIGEETVLVAAPKTKAAPSPKNNNKNQKQQ
jgi:hypothetical protein